MHLAYEILLATAFLFLATAAWISSVFAAPGNWIAVALTLLYGLLEGFNVVTWWVLAIGVLAASMGELREFIGSYVGARSIGASRLAGVLAIVGCIVGAVAGASIGWGLGAIPGTILGALLGGLAGELIREKKMNRAIGAGLGAALGRTLGLSGKLAFGGGFLLLLYIRLLTTSLVY
jgi:uncharacterized protein YqgC (DUF456 family)